jgi:hypothetical protein
MKKSENGKVEKRMVQSVIVNGTGARRCNLDILVASKQHPVS